MRWLEVKVTVAAEAVEAVGERLLTLGARGFWTVGVGPVRALVSYFPCLDEGGGGPDGPVGPDGSSGPVAVLSVFLARLQEWGLDPGPAEVSTRVVDEVEWRDQWKAFFHPIRVGRRLIIHPPWEKPVGQRSGVEAVERRIGNLSIVIDPGQAFGTGDHATTRGAVELVEATLDAREGQGRVSSAVDLGTGSGILAIVAAKLGVPRVVAVDNDPVATVAARANVAANGLAGRVEVVDGNLEDVLGTDGGKAPGVERRERPDLIMANLTTDLIVFTLPMMATALRPGGVIVAAGVSSGEGEDRVMEMARSVGLAEIDRRSAENWVSFAFTKAPGRSPRGDRAPCGLARGDPAAPGLAGRGGTVRGRPRAVFYTLGCKANLYDTAGMMGQLRQDGWEIVAGQEERPDGEAHDLYVVNSCAVTARAESKTGQLVRRLRREHPGVLVALVGCYPEVQRGPPAASKEGRGREGGCRRGRRRGREGGCLVRRRSGLGHLRPPPLAPTPSPARI